MISMWGVKISSWSEEVVKIGSIQLSSIHVCASSMFDWICRFGYVCLSVSGNSTVNESEINNALMLGMVELKGSSDPVCPERVFVNILFAHQYCV